MAKKAPFFSHDMNARHDPKISAMRGVYGAEGYGWFWMLIELMAESDGYQLDCKSKYAFNAYAMQLQCKADDVHKFVSDCIEEFDLFITDGTTFWSNSLRNRMQYRDAVSEKRAEAANKRWEKKQSDAIALENDANAMQKNANETKQNETKQNNIKDISGTEVPKRTKFTIPTIEQVKTYCDERSNSVDPVKWHDYYTSNGWKVGKNSMKDWKAAVRTWEKSSITNTNTNIYPIQSKADKDAQQREELKREIVGGMTLEDIGKARSIIDITPNQNSLPQFQPRQ
ncbi:DUF4373 domain-containing protein [Paenibacillus sp. FSL R10-2791]|uniref:DUF4373 domain-containing protein n=1 Tax=Paenibacillus sp. FSL R10-2791 TaxID=2954695 RepID=UPI0030F4BE71